MAFQFSVAARNASLDAIETATGTGPTLEIRSGAVPANAAAADAGTLLATITLPSDWLANASAGSKARAGTWSGTASAAGTAGHFRMQRGGTNISGQTAQTITLDAGAMGLADSDTISCEITATNSQGSATAEPSVLFTGGATSLVDTDDFTTVNTDANNSAILSANSFEMARQPSGGTTAIPSYQFALAPGAYRFRFTVAAFEAGADPNITLIDIQLRDGTTQITRPNSAGAVDVTFTVVSGNLEFRVPTSGRGARVTSLLITAA